MPWHIGKSDSCPADKPWAVITDDSGDVRGCHASRESAQQQLAVLNIKMKQGEISAGEWETAMAWVLDEHDRR